MHDDLMHNLIFAEMICTRFCHDMAGPVSALYNGMEYIRDEDCTEDMLEQVHNLLTTSSGESLSRLQVYRLAYGRVAEGETCSLMDLKQTLGRFFKFHRVNLIWGHGFETETGDQKMAGQMRQVLVNMITIMQSFMSYGGNMKAERYANDMGKWRIRVFGESEKLKHDEELSRILLNTEIEEEFTPHNTPAWFFRKLTYAQDINYSFLMEEKHVEIIADC